MTTTQDEWYTMLEQDMTPVDAPGHMKVGEIVNAPTEQSPLPMRIHDLAFKGYVEVWDTRTGIQSLQPKWLLWQTMNKKREDGSPVFTLTNPQIAANYGENLFCYLHPQSPEYDYLKTMGFNPCRKKHLPHEDARRRHCMSSHKRAWAALDEAKQRRERDEDRQLQRDMLKAMTQAAVRGVTQDGPEAPERPVETPISVAPQPYLADFIKEQTRVADNRVPPERLTCSEEGCEYVAAGTPNQQKVRLGWHMKKH